MLLRLARAGITIREYAPALVKRSIVGKGAADKKQVAMVITAILRLPARPAPTPPMPWRSPSPTCTPRAMTSASRPRGASCAGSPWVRSPPAPPPLDQIVRLRVGTVRRRSSCWARSRKQRRSPSFVGVSHPKEIA